MDTQILFEQLTWAFHQDILDGKSLGAQKDSQRIHEILKEALENAEENGFESGKQSGYDSGYEQGRWDFTDQSPDDIW